MNTAQYTNLGRPETIQSMTRGKNSLAVLAIGENEPQNQEMIAAKIASGFVESYLRRPSLKDEAIQKMTEFAHDALTQQQSASYPVACHLAVLATLGNQFRWMTLGDVRIYHFVNGQIMRSNEGSVPPLGSRQGEKRPDGISATDFSQGENSFLICSGSFARAVREHEMENTLSMADSAEDWLRLLRELYEDRAEEPFALQTVFIPARRKRMPKKAVIAICIALVVLAVGAFFAMGALRRKNGGEGGPGQRPPQQGQEMPQPPAPPTEPPEPEPPQGGGGNPGQKPTKPPRPEQPTQPPAPTQP